MTFSLLGFMAVTLLVLGSTIFALTNLWQDVRAGCLGSYGWSWLGIGVIIVAVPALAYLIAYGPQT